MPVRSKAFFNFAKVGGFLCSFKIWFVIYLAMNKCNLVSLWFPECLTLLKVYEKNVTVCECKGLTLTAHL